MRAVRISEDIVSVSEFKAQAAAWLRRIAETGHPLVVTLNGKAAGVLLSPSQFDALSERARFVSAVDAALAEAEAGRVHSHAIVVARVAKRRRARAFR